MNRESFMPPPTNGVVTKGALFYPALGGQVIVITLPE